MNWLTWETLAMALAFNPAMAFGLGVIVGWVTLGLMVMRTKPKRSESDFDRWSDG